MRNGCFCFFSFSQIYADLGFFLIFHRKRSSDISGCLSLLSSKNAAYRLIERFAVQWQWKKLGWKSATVNQSVLKLKGLIALWPLCSLIFLAVVKKSLFETITHAIILKSSIQVHVLISLWLKERQWLIIKDGRIQYKPDCRLQMNCWKRVFTAICSGRHRVVWKYGVTTSTSVVHLHWCHSFCMCICCDDHSKLST